VLLQIFTFDDRDIFKSCCIFEFSAVKISIYNPYEHNSVYTKKQMYKHSLAYTRTSTKRRLGATFIHDMKNKSSTCIGRWSRNPQ
jgi:hypothetical protein